MTKKKVTITYKRMVEDNSYKKNMKNVWSDVITEEYFSRKDGLTRYLNILDHDNNNEFPNYGVGSVCSLKYFENGVDMTSRMNNFIGGYNKF